MRSELPNGCFCGSARWSRRGSRSARRGRSSPRPVARPGCRSPSRPSSPRRLRPRRRARPAPARTSSGSARPRSCGPLQPESTRSFPQIGVNGTVQGEEVSALPTLTHFRCGQCRKGATTTEQTGLGAGGTAAWDGGAAAALALGFNAREIEHRVARRRLHLRYARGLCRGWPRLTPKRRWMAAVLACGRGRC